MLRLNELIFVFLLFATFTAIPPQIQVVDLRAEYLVKPTGIIGSPRFSWILAENGYNLTATRGQKQTAFQLLVCSQSACLKGDVWDSGKIVSAKSFLVKYGGKALQSSTKYYWKVRAWDRDSVLSNFSDTTHFVSGLMQQSEWSASRWITSPDDSSNQFRTTFTLPSNEVVRSAVAHISGIGYFEFQCNGKKFGDRLLDVGWTDYAKRAYYVTFDITDKLVNKQSNVFGITLGNGWFSCLGGQPGCTNTTPQLRLVASITFASGRTVQVTSNTNGWKCYPGPIQYNSLYNGETYDARAITPGWAEPNYNDQLWKPVVAAQVAPAIISPQLFEPIRRISRLLPQSISEPLPNIFIVDFGQNTAGTVRIKIRNCLWGQNVTIKHAEVLMHPPYGPYNGSLYYGNLRKARATDIYICTGNLVDEYTPTFTQHGFRYIEIQGLTLPPVEDDVYAHEVHTDVEEIGEFITNHQLINRIQHNVVWGQKSNLMSLPTDCPQRDERRGWMGDAGLTAEEAILNFEMSALYTNWLNIIVDDQNSDGSVTDFVPSLGDTNNGAPNWQTAYPTIIWTMLQYRGDVDLVNVHYRNLKLYFNFFESQWKQTGLANFYTGYGDWVPPSGHSMGNGHLVSSFSYLRDLGLWITMLRAIGQNSEADQVQTFLNARKVEFNTAFFSAAKNVYGSGLQTEMSMALWLGLVPPAARTAVINNLVNDIVVTNNVHVTTGILGWKFLLEALTLNGLSNIGISLNLQDTYPSIGYMIQGKANYEPATTIWELWNSDSGNAGMDSRNHIMFGTVGSWLYKSFLGFDFSQGLNNVVVGPDASIINMVNTTNAAGKTRTPYGDLSLSWFVTSSQYAINVIVPFGMTLTVRVPILPALKQKPENILVMDEGQIEIWMHQKFHSEPGITKGWISDDQTTLFFLVSSGSYQFTTSTTPTRSVNNLAYQLNSKQKKA